MTEFKQVVEHIGSGEREFFSRARDGEMSAFEKLVELHRDDVYAFGLVITGSEAEAGEIAQEGFLSACLHLQQFSNEAEFTTWVYRVAATSGELRLRCRSVRPAEARLHSRDQEQRGSHRFQPDGVRDTMQTGLSAELRRTIWEAAERLPHHHRAVLFLKDVLGFSYDRVSDITGQSVDEIKPRLHEARLKLREVIDRVQS